MSRAQTTDRPIISVDFSDGHEVFQTYYHSQFTENQRAAILHICANAGRDPVPPNVRLVSVGLPVAVGLDGFTDIERSARQAGPPVGEAEIDGRPLSSFSGAAKPILLASEEAPKPAPVSREDAHKKARMSGFTGDLCSQCGSDRMRRNGSCLLCEGCGATTGCS